MKQLLLDFEEVSIIEATPLKNNSVEEAKISFRISEASPKIVNSGNKVNIRDFMLQMDSDLEPTQTKKF